MMNYKAQLFALKASILLTLLFNVYCFFVVGTEAVVIQYGIIFQGLGFLSIWRSIHDNNLGWTIEAWAIKKKHNPKAFAFIIGIYFCLGVIAVFIGGLISLDYWGESLLRG